MGLLKAAKAKIEAWQFRRSPLGRALRDHAATYFYSGEVLSWMTEENRQRFVDDFMMQLMEIRNAPNSALALRGALAGYVGQFAGLAVLGLTEPEKAVQSYAGSPYISGQLFRHIEQAAPHNEAFAKFIREQGGAVSAEDLVGFANTRSSIALFYANGLNMVRTTLGDTEPPNDWFQPFIEAMMVWEEGKYRERIGLPQLVTGAVGTIPYSLFRNYVEEGALRPFQTWTTNWPDHYLAGKGPLPS